jgi:hypothetical protein
MFVCLFFCCFLFVCSTKVWEDTSHLVKILEVSPRIFSHHLQKYFYSRDRLCLQFGVSKYIHYTSIAVHSTTVTRSTSQPFLKGTTRQFRVKNRPPFFGDGVVPVFCRLNNWCAKTSRGLQNSLHVRATNFHKAAYTNKECAYNCFCILP